MITAGTSDQMVAWLDTLFLHGSTPTQMKQTILTAVGRGRSHGHDGPGTGGDLSLPFVVHVRSAALSAEEREMTRHTRRDMLRLACCSAAGASLVSGLSKLGLVSALAQGTTDYKALVCIFMFGGNDSNNMLVPTDSRYTQYLQARSVLALPQSQLLPLQIERTVDLRAAPEHAGDAGVLQQSKITGDCCERGNAGAAHDASDLPARFKICRKIFSRTPTSRTSGRARNSPEHRYPAGPARSPTMSRRSTPPRSFRRFSRSPAVPSSAPASPRGHSRWTPASRRA